MTMTCLDDGGRHDGDQLVSAFAEDVRRAYTGPPPQVGPALAEVLVSGTGTAAADRRVPVVVPDRAGGGFLARLGGRRPRVALSAAVASLTFLGVGAAGALPGPAQSAFDRAADAIGVRLPAAGAGGSTAPAVHELDDRARTLWGGPQDEDGAGAGGTVPAPPAGDRHGTAPPGHPAGPDASSATPAPAELRLPGWHTGGRPQAARAERSAADDRPAPVPERGRGPDDGGGPGLGVGPGGGTDSDDRAGAGSGRGSQWHRPSWVLSQEDSAQPGRAPGHGEGAGQSAGAFPEGAYPSGPSRR